MQVENQPNVEGQQPNPGEAGGTGAPAANPDGQTGTDPNAPEGQGKVGDDAGGDPAGSGTGDEGKDGNTDGGEGTGDGQGDGAPESLLGVPEAYADFTLPDGFTLDGDRREAAQTLFRDLGLSQAGAQRAIDHFIKTVGEDEAVRAAALEGAVAQQREDWGKQAKAELGDKYDEEVAMATTFVQATQNPKLIEAFDELGWGNHPELIKVFAMAGRLARDSSIDGIGSAGAETPAKKPWETLYGDSMKT
jgi:hypothetical protein